MTGTPPRLSQSIAKILLAKGPFHAWHYHRELGKLTTTSKAMDGGTLIHELVLGGDKIEILDHRKWRTGPKRDKPAKQDFTSGDAKKAAKWARAFGKVPVLQKTVDAVQTPVKAIRDALDAFGIDLTDPKWHVEERLKWEQDGVPCEGTPDIWGEREGLLLCADLKNVGKGIEPDKLGTTAATEWAIQYGAYRCALEILHPEWAGRIDWRWLLAEPNEPYQVQWVPGDWCLRELGERQWMRAVKLWGELLALGWEKPWDPIPFELTAPVWALNREAEHDEAED